MGSYTILTDRAHVTVKGADSLDFLQGLVTQDLTTLGGRMLYGAMLTPQGKMDHEFFISRASDAITLECEAARADTLAKKLTTYKLRKQVSIDIKPVRIFQSWNGVADGYTLDPRPLPAASRGVLDKVQGVEAPNEDYYRACILKRIPCGSRDIAWGEDTVADLNLEYLGGVSYTKGCYMGQELTSRMHHRALSKKGLYAVAINGAPLPAFTDIMADGNLIGEMRSCIGNTGLAMLRHDSLELAPRAGLTPL